VWRPGSVSWQVNRESVLLLGAGRALLLQVAHPLVGAGVANHSSYQSDPWGRLLRTLDTTTAIGFGSLEEAEEATRRVGGVHRRVRGTIAEPLGPYPAGSRYEARAPELALWVHATLVDTALLVYDGFVRRLSLAERERYYEEQKRFAEIFGVPRERQPPRYADFNHYFDGVVERELVVTDVVRDVLDAITRPELPEPLTGLSPFARPLLEPFRLATVGLLPARLRQGLGLAWGPGHERVLAAQARLVRALLPLLPGIFRQLPRARKAEGRLATGWAAEAQFSDGSAGIVASSR